MAGNAYPGGERGDGAIPMGPEPIDAPIKLPAWLDSRDKMQEALQGTGWTAVPVEQLASIYERFLRLNRIGSRTIDEWLAMSDDEKGVRHAVFTQSDFGAVFSGQWLPRDLRDAVWNRLKAEWAVKG